jgi:hypothetical protein
MTCGYEKAKEIKNNEIDEAIEQLIDRKDVNVSGVLLSVINVCMLKAEHLRST